MFRINTKASQKLMVFLIWVLALWFAFPVVRAQTSTPVTYTTFEQKVLSLYPWVGQKVVVLSASPDLNPTTMQSMDRIGVNGGPFNGYLPYAQFESSILTDLLHSP